MLKDEKMSKKKKARAGEANASDLTFVDLGDGSCILFANGASTRITNEQRNHISGEADDDATPSD